MHTKFFQELLNKLDEFDPTSVASISGVSLQTIYNWLNGKVHNPQLRTIFAVAKALDMDIVLVQKAVRSNKVTGRKHLRLVA